MIIGMDERGETMAGDNRWAGFSDEELQLIADRLGDALLSVELRQERKDRARIVEEINAEFRRREDEQSTYRGPGRYVGYGRRLEVFGTIDDPDAMGTQAQVVMRDEGDHSGVLMQESLPWFNEARDSTSRCAYEYLGPLEKNASDDAEVQRLKLALRRVHNHDEATSEIRGIVESVILFGHDVPEQATAPATVKIIAAGHGWVRLEDSAGDLYQFKVGDTITVPAPVAEKTVVPDYERADGRLICHSSAKPCGRVYRNHPTETYGDLVLHRLCDGRLVKL
jgi:hypothetical protein